MEPQAPPIDIETMDLIIRTPPVLNVMAQSGQITPRMLRVLVCKGHLNPTVQLDFRVKQDTDFPFARLPESIIEHMACYMDKRTLVSMAQASKMTQRMANDVLASMTVRLTGANATKEYSDAGDSVVPSYARDVIVTPAAKSALKTLHKRVTSLRLYDVPMDAKDVREVVARVPGLMELGLLAQPEATPRRIFRGQVYRPLLTSVTLWPLKSLKLTSLDLSRQVCTSKCAGVIAELTTLKRLVLSDAVVPNISHISALVGIETLDVSGIVLPDDIKIPGTCKDLTVSQWNDAWASELTALTRLSAVGEPKAMPETLRHLQLHADTFVPAVIKLTGLETLLWTSAKGETYNAIQPWLHTVTLASMMFKTSPGTHPESMIGFRRNDAVYEYTFVNIAMTMQFTLALSARTGLVSLTLNRCDIADAGIARIFPGLRTLCLAGNPGIHLGGLRSLTRLTDLDVSGCALNEEQMAIIGEMTQLEDLNLRDNKIVAHLGVLRDMRCLRRLDLRGCGITEAHLESLENIGVETVLISGRPLAISGPLDYRLKYLFDAAEVFEDEIEVDE